MTISTLQGLGISPDVITAQGPARQAAAAEATEAMFASMLLKEMRNTLESGLFGNEGSDTYGQMFDMFMGQHLAESNALGIQTMIVEQTSPTPPASIPP